MSATDTEDGKPINIEHPTKSGIRIREIRNATNGQEFRSSFMVTIPGKLTGTQRLRRQFPELEKAKEWAGDQLHTGRMLGGAFYKLTEREQRQCVEALDVLRPKGLSILVAAKFAAERLAPESSTKTAADVLTEFIMNRKTGKAAARYLEDLKSRLTRFAEKFTGPLSHVTSTEIGDWIAGLELSAQTQTNFRRVIGTMIQFAKDRDYLPRAFDEHERIKVSKVKGEAEIAIFTSAEVARLLAAASPEFMPCVALSAFAGLRSAEVERLDWSEIKLADRIIELRSSKAKTRSRRIIPIADNLALWLAGHAKESGLIWKGTHEAFYEEQQKTAKAAGMDWKQNGLRHAYVSHRLALVKDAAKVSLESGNSPGVVFKHYRELVRESDAQAYFAIVPKPSKRARRRQARLPANVTPLPAAVA